MGNKSVRFFMAALLLSLTSCNHDDSPKYSSQQSNCFDISRGASASDRMSEILINKCTGDTWSIATTKQLNDKGGVASISYNWYKINKYEFPAEYTPTQFEK